MKLLSNLNSKGKRTLTFIWVGALTVILVLVAVIASAFNKKYDFSKYTTKSYDNNFAISLAYYENRHSSYENPSHDIEFSDYCFEVVVRGIKENNCTYSAKKINIEMVVKTISGEYYHLSESKTSLLTSLNNGKSISIKMDELTKNVHDESDESSTCNHVDQTPAEVYVNVYYYTVKTISSKDADGKTVKETVDVKGNIYYKTNFKDIEKLNYSDCNDKTFNKTSTDNTYESASSNNEIVGFKVKYTETSGKTPTSDNGVSVDKIEVTTVLNKDALGTQVIEDCQVVIVGNIKNEILDYKNKFTDKIVVANFSGNINEYTKSISNSVDELYDLDVLYFFVTIKTNEKTVTYQYKLNLQDLK